MNRINLIKRAPFFGAIAFAVIAAGLLLPPFSPGQQVADKSKEVSGEEVDFVRYAKDERSEKLETAVIRYERQGTIVDLVAMVHIADAEFFSGMNERLKSYDAVLYELVGGKFEDREEGELAPEMATIQVAQKLVKLILGLEYQADGIDYRAKNFVHADIDWEQYDALMSSRNQSFGTIFQRALAQAQSGNLPGLPNGEAEAQTMVNSMMASMTSGNTADIKRVIGPILGNAETLITSLEGDDGTVLVTERNKVVMKIIDRELAGGRRSLAILYGAGHMPDLEKRLLATGFRKTDESWLTAWNIVDVPPEKRVNVFQQLFSDPELMQALMTGIQEAMKQFQETPAQ